MSGGAARPLTSHVTKERAQCGGTIISRGRRGGAIKSTNKEQPGPGVRQTTVAIYRLGGYRYAHAGPGKLPVTERAAADPCEQQRRSRRNRTATASAKLTSVRLPQSGTERLSKE